MGQEIKAFTISRDGTIERTAGAPVTQETEYDQMCLNIIRVGSNYDSILGAYKARKKCYKIAKDFEKRFDYKEHVQQLQLDYFPSEFKKSLIGESYLNWLIWSIIGAVLLCWLIIPLFFFGWLIYYQTNKKRQEIESVEAAHTSSNS